MSQEMWMPSQSSHASQPPERASEDVRDRGVPADHGEHARDPCTRNGWGSSPRRAQDVARRPAPLLDRDLGHLGKRLAVPVLAIREVADDEDLGPVLELQRGR
jgi:hypothetical protein